MKRRGFLKFLGTAAAVPVVAPLAMKATESESKRAVQPMSEADKWRKLCGYCPPPVATLSFAAYDLNHPMFFGPITLHPGRERRE